MHIVMVAAENGALKGGKVGGIGDVIRDVPQALARLGHQVTVLVPGYQMLCRLNACHLKGTLTVAYGGAPQTIEYYQAAETSRKPADSGDPCPGSVRNLLLEHPLFGACGTIYCDDHHGPFGTDANKFALFCAGVASMIVRDIIRDVDVVHLHDWHTAVFTLLRSYSPEHSRLREIPVAFTIHNLSLQGIRPQSYNASSPAAWFPDLHIPAGETEDPRYAGCINLMRTAIRLSDRVHAVSHSYAKEILRASDPSGGFIGGEGLEQDLQHVADQGRLCGILNGCDYAHDVPSADDGQLLELIDATLRHWALSRDSIPAAHFFALLRVQQWRQRNRPVNCRIVSVGRLTDQKVRLLKEDVTSRSEPSSSALERLLDMLGDDGLMIMLGSGDPLHERFFTRMMHARENFLFLCGFSEELADVLYAYGDLFLMPSSFEPCGISQMLAMRAGTPCIVHGVGGLKDTVKQRKNGYVFHGSSPPAQARAMLKTFQQALKDQEDPVRRKSLRDAAAATRFLWEDTAKAYVDQLYRP
jgi:starch synthase